MNSKIQELIYRAIDQSISAEEFDRLQEAMKGSPEVRREYLRAIHLTESLADIAAAFSTESSADDEVAETGRHPIGNERGALGSWHWPHFAIAASVLFLLTGAAFWVGRQDRLATRELAETPTETEGTESRIAGHATLRRSVDLLLPPEAPRRREGDVLPNGLFAFERGVVEIDFFCGATLIVEGPASLNIESDWSVTVTEGRLRATVPPAARGFVVKTDGAEIVDLGTEFALEVGDEDARVEVIDGEVALRGGSFDGRHLVTGEGQTLKGDLSQTGFSEELSTVSEIRQRQHAAEQQRFEKWETHLNKRRQDERLVAFYPIAASQTGRLVQDLSPGQESDGLLVGPVDRSVGRFGSLSSGLNFDRPGARVRTRIDGTFRSFSFVCWVRIDSLEHRYNALFMADSYETGEPHWQIRDDGRLMFSVMVDDTQDVEFFNRREQKMVRDAGLHRVYYSDPVWDLSKSGQWFHLAAIYDPIGRHVTQYVNGERVASERIVDKFHIETLKIGAAEMGNWGQPFRNSPWFAVRNLDGTLDELAIFKTALTQDEVKDLYEKGKPLGY